MSALEPLKPLGALSTILGLCLALTACTSAAERQAEANRIAELDHRHCIDLGFEPGTEPYGNCRLKLREIRAQESARYNTNPRIGIGVGVGTHF